MNQSMIYVWGLIFNFWFLVIFIRVNISFKAWFDCYNSFGLKFTVTTGNESSVLVIVNVVAPVAEKIATCCPS